MVENIRLLYYFTFGQAPGFFVQLSAEGGADYQIVVDQLTCGRIARAVGYSPGDEFARAGVDFHLAEAQLPEEFLLMWVYTGIVDPGYWCNVVFEAARLDNGYESPAQVCPLGENFGSEFLGIITLEPDLAESMSPNTGVAGYIKCIGAIFNNDTIPGR